MIPTKKQNIKSETGQSLLEVTIALGILIIILGAMTIISVNGLKNSQFSKNQAQSTKLAQEGIDAVKTVQSQNCKTTLGGVDYYWGNIEDTGGSLIWTDWTAATPVTVQYTLNPLVSPADCRLYSGTSENINNLSRSVTLEKITSGGQCTNSAPCILVISDVRWTDAGGVHDSKLSTTLTQK